jgi:hypothetical protein
VETQLVTESEAGRFSHGLVEVKWGTIDYRAVSHMGYAMCVRSREKKAVCCEKLGEFIGGSDEGHPTRE